MDVTTFFRLAKRQFGDEYEVIINDDDIYGWIYNGETEIIRHTGSNTTIVNTTVGAFPVTIPDIVNVKRIVIDGKALTSVSLEELDLLGVSETASGTPQYFYREDRKLYLYPQMTGSTAVVIYYNKVPALMSGPTGSATFAVPEIYHNDLLHFVLSRMHNKFQNHASESVERELFEKSIGIRKEEAQAPEDGPLYKIDDPMDFAEVDWFYR